MSSDPNLPLSSLDESETSLDSAPVPRRSADAISRAELLRASSPLRSARSPMTTENMIPPKLPPPPPPPPPGITAMERRRRRRRALTWLVPAAAVLAGWLIGWLYR